jgi:hypothetical protein
MARKVWEPVYGYGDAVHIDDFKREVWQWEKHERPGANVGLSVDIGQRSFPIDLPDNIRLCQLVPQEGMAMPDGPSKRIRTLIRAALEDAQTRNKISDILSPNEIIKANAELAEALEWLHKQPWDAARGE